MDKYYFSSGIRNFISHILPYALYCIHFKDKCTVCMTSESCKSLVFQDKCNIEIFLSPAMVIHPMVNVLKF